MLMAICAAIFVLVMGFAMWYGSMVLMNALWNSKWSQKSRKEAAEALIRVEKLLQEYDI